MRYRSRKRKKKRLPSELQNAKARALRVLGILVRFSSADAQGFCTCITCGFRAMWNDGARMNAGHFIPKARGNFAKFERTNIAPQCSICNCYYGGQMEKFRDYMLATFGANHVNWLEKLANERVSYNLDDYHRMTTGWIDELRKVGYHFEIP